MRKEYSVVVKWADAQPVVRVIDESLMADPKAELKWFRRQLGDVAVKIARAQGEDVPAKAPLQTPEATEIVYGAEGVTVWFTL